MVQVRTAVAITAEEPVPARRLGARGRCGAIRSLAGCLVLSLVAAILCGWLVHPRVHMLSLALGAVLAIGTLWPRLSVAGVRGTLEFGRTRIREGESAGIELTLRNRLPWSLSGLTVRAEEEAGWVDWATVRVLPGWSTRRVQLEFVPDRRGEYPASRVQIECGFPFGIYRAYRDLQVVRRLLVWPRTWPVREMPPVPGMMEENGPCFLNKPGFHGDILAVRPYRRGDPLRRVHWPQTARHDRLIVCERQASWHPEITVWLDTTPDHHAGGGGHNTLERAIRAAASLCESWIDGGASVGLIAGDQAIEPDGGRAHKEYLLDVLALIPRQGAPVARRPVRIGRNTVLVTTDLRPQEERSPLAGSGRVIVLRHQARAGGSGGYDQADAARVREALHAW